MTEVQEKMRDYHKRVRNFAENRGLNFHTKLYSYRNTCDINSEQKPRLEPDKDGDYFQCVCSVSDIETMGEIRQNKEAAVQSCARVLKQMLDL